MRYPNDALKVDWDAHDEALSVHEVCRRLRWAGFTVRWWREDYSPSGKGRHLILALSPRPRDPMTVVALQAILDSDPSREACNVMRVRNLPRMPRWARERWNTLYQKGGTRGAH